MSIDDDYYAWDAAQQEFYEQAAAEAVKEFKRDLLQNYLLKTYESFARTIHMLGEADELNERNTTAGYLFAAISAEVCVKQLLLEPMVHGLITQDYAASLVSELVFGRNSVDRFRVLFLKLLAEEGNIDLKSMKRIGADICIWDEFIKISRKRNAIVHNAEQASKSESVEALAVAQDLIHQIYPQLLDNFYLTVFQEKIIYHSYLPLDQYLIKEAQRKLREG